MADATRGRTLISPPQDSKVSILSPGSSPRVLHLPIILSVSAVTDSENSVIDCLSAVCFDDASLVEMKDMGVNSNGNWLASDGSPESLIIEWLGSGHSFDGEHELGGVGSTWLKSSLVRVSALGLNASLFDDVEKSFPRQSSMTAVIQEASARAVDELLL